MPVRMTDVVSSLLNDLLASEGQFFDLFKGPRAPYGSPAGKARMAKAMVAVIPEHKVYVEPFAGAAAVLFEKERSETEAINDLDPDISDALKTLASMSDSDVQALLKRDWKASPETYLRLFESSPSDAMDRLYRFLYLSKMSFGFMRGKTNYAKANTGKDTHAFFERRLLPAVERLRGVKVHSEDYADVVKKYDSPETFLFLDPPYAGYGALAASGGKEKGVAESAFDEERFFNVLKSLKGKWLLNYGERGELPKMLKAAGYDVRILHKPRSFRGFAKTKDPEEGAKTVGHLLASNCGIDLKKIN